MNLNWLVSFLSFLFFFGFHTTINAQNVFNGDVELNTQAEVNTFGAKSYTKIVGFLLIKGNDITDLSPLNSLDTVTHSIFIEYNRKLKVLNGFDNLILIGGNLQIENNTELDSVGTFGKVKKIKGPLVLRDNFLLRECCAFYDLLTGEQGTIIGGWFIEGNKGCRSEKELRENCDSDSDNDGVDDSMDGCPNDPLKIQPGTCGCGQSELDSDRDGTPDCKDDCPNDPAKTKEGSCGCGESDTDTDGDGVADCNDDCPYNSSITQAGICGCSNPRILDVQISNIGSCRDNGTPSRLDDTFTADITITFEGAPTSGTLLITGGTKESVSFYQGNTSKSLTLFSLPFNADGELIEVIATFKNNSACTKRRVFGIFAPESCSSGACDPPTDIKTEFEEESGAMKLNWNNAGSETSYEVEYRQAGGTSWVSMNTATNQLTIHGLLEYTNYEYRIRSYCDQQKYSEYTYGTFSSGGKECKIIRGLVQNIRCSDNETPENPDDDYFLFDLFVEGINVSSGYKLDKVSEENTGKYNKSGTFKTAPGTLGKGDIILSVSDLENDNCLSQVTVKDPGICSYDCKINYITIDTVYKCWDRGTRWNKKDDFFTADLTVHFMNPPNMGELVLSGGVKGSVSVTSLQNSNSYTFKEIALPASGSNFSVHATFSNGSNCEYIADFKGLLIKENNICKNQCNILNAQLLTLECSDDQLTFELVVTGINLSGEYRVSNVAGTNTGYYNQSSFFRTNSKPVNQEILFEITDLNDANCSFTLTVDNKCLGKRRPSLKTHALDEPQQLKIYPNPARDKLFISYRTASEKVNVQVYNLLGQKLINQPFNGKTINISNLDKGIYHLVVQEKNKLLVKKFIKE